jgi:hypothetical protein
MRPKRSERGASNIARLAGLSLLGALAALVVGVNNYPSFDARSEYFPLAIPRLIESQAEFRVALGFIATIGVLLVLAGVAATLAFSQSGAATLIPGSILAVSGGGFLLSAALGLAALRILVAAGNLSVADGRAHAATAYPWASGSQTSLLMIGLGFLALGLLALIVVMLRAGAFSRPAIVVALALPVVLWIVIALAVEGAPLVWLVPGLPVVVWTVGLGFFLIVTGRVVAPPQVATA